jgi:hypothetical protein
VARATKAKRANDLMRDMLRARAFLEKLLSNNYADGYFIVGYGHPSHAVVFISTVSHENVNMSKHDVYKQMGMR